LHYDADAAFLIRGIGHVREVVEGGLRQLGGILLL
jgi:hypothetical protein